MKCWRCCLCCCSCLSPASEKSTALDDASSLIQEGSVSAPGDQEVQAFYVPRRHSSFNTSTYSTVSLQPGKCHSDSCSSSEDDESSHGEQRGRCWSTIPATTATDVAALVSNRCSNNHKQTGNVSNCRPVSNQEPDSPHRPSLLFDKHKLAEIRETEPGDVIREEDEGEDHPHEAEEDAGALPTPSDEIYGYLSFSTTYDENEQRLLVYLDRASDLPKKSVNPDHEHPYSTFVRLSITSSRKTFLLSRPVKNSLSPVYKEDHVFHTNRAKWKSFWGTALRLSVYDCDRQGRHDAVGHALLPLAKISDKQEIHRLPLTPMSTPVKNLGQLLLGLFYSPTQSRLSIHVIKARHLKLHADVHKRNLKPLNKGKDALDTFVKVTLMCGGQKVKTNRSQVVVENVDPFFNHKSDFVVPPTFLPESSVVVTVVVKGVLGRSLILGRVTTGPYVDTCDGTLTQWGRMAQDSRSVVQWRNLYL